MSIRTDYLKNSLNFVHYALLKRKGGFIGPLHLSVLFNG